MSHRPDLGHMVLGSDGQEQIPTLPGQQDETESEQTPARGAACGSDDDGEHVHTTTPGSGRNSSDCSEHYPETIANTSDEGLSGEELTPEDTVSSLDLHALSPSTSPSSSSSHSSSSDSFHEQQYHVLCRTSSLEQKSEDLEEKACDIERVLAGTINPDEAARLEDRLEAIRRERRAIGRELHDVQEEGRRLERARDDPYGTTTEEEVSDSAGDDPDGTTAEGVSNSAGDDPDGTTAEGVTDTTTETDFAAQPFQASTTSMSSVDTDEVSATGPVQTDNSHSDAQLSQAYPIGNRGNTKKRARSNSPLRSISAYADTLGLGTQVESVGDWANQEDPDSQLQECGNPSKRAKTGD
ncbi:MAG: hypothetical protein L6R39_004001 [Caloplaca ligustica]|nr:MAG: hypothetical protein L6R39_004001 [Caloplaca ligustica]